MRTSEAYVIEGSEIGRRWWAGALPIVMLLSIAPLASADETTVLRVATRPRIGMVYLAAESERARVSVSAMQAALAKAVEEHTRLRVEVVDAELRSCEGALSCIVGRAHAAAPGAPAPLLLVVSVRATPGEPDLVSVVLVDDASAWAIQRAEAGPSADRDAIEAQIAREAVLARPPLATVEDEGALDRVAARIVSALVPALERRGFTERFGRVRLHAPPGVQIEVDGQIAGVTGASTTLVDVETGTRAVTLRSGESIHESRVWVRPDRAAELTFVDMREVAPRRAALVWTGAAMAAAGAAVVVVGILNRSDTPAATCESTGNDAFVCTYDAFDRLTPNGGPLVIPAGYSLASAGLSMIAGPALFDADTIDPLWWWVVGAGVFAASYAVSEAAN